MGNDAKSANSVLYVCASGRSGSTLVDRLMGFHIQCLSLWEIEHLPRNMKLDTPCACGQRARSCPFWNEVAAYLGKRHGMDILVLPYQFPVGLYQTRSVIDPEHKTRAYLCYEDLARDPVSALRSLCTFLNRPYEPEMHQFRRTIHHILNGNDMRLPGVQTIRPDERWRSELDGEELAYFENVAGKMNRRLGYE